MTARSPTMVTLRDTRFVQYPSSCDCRTVKTIVGRRSSLLMIPVPEDLKLVVRYSNNYLWAERKKEISGAPHNCQRAEKKHSLYFAPDTGIIHKQPCAYVSLPFY